MECPVCKIVKQYELENWELPEVHATPRQLDELESNPAWMDIKNTIIAWLIKGRDELEDIDPSKATEIAALKGGSHMLRAVLNLPMQLKEEKEALNEQRAREQDDQRRG